MCQWYADCSLQIKERESTFHSQLHIAHPQTRKQANTPHPTRSRSHALTLNAQRSTLNAQRFPSFPGEKQLGLDWRGTETKSRVI